MNETIIYYACYIVSLFYGNIFRIKKIDNAYLTIGWGEQKHT